MSRIARGGGVLHVLTLTPFFPSAGDDVSGCFVAEPLEQLRELGIDSSVIAGGPIYHPAKQKSATAPAEWVRYPQMPGTLGLSGAGRLLYARVRREVRNLHCDKPIDVIHAHAALPFGHAAALLSQHLKIPFVVTVHGLDVFNSCFRGGMAAESRWRGSVDVFRAARNVICVSGKVQEILEAGAPVTVRSTVVYNGVNPDLFAPDMDDAQSLDQEILMVGNLLRSKGHELVLRALADLHPAFPALRLRIIGEGPDRAFYESLVSELGIGGHVLFSGRQSRAEVAKAMRHCSIFVLPSRNESLGCVYLEAMSSGKPVIACQGQGIEEVIEHGQNGWLIPADGRIELVQGVSALLKSPETRMRIGASARHAILDGLTLRDQAEHLFEVYRQAASKPRTAAL